MTCNTDIIYLKKNMTTGATVDADGKPVGTGSTSTGFQIMSNPLVRLEVVRNAGSTETKCDFTGTDIHWTATLDNDYDHATAPIAFTDADFNEDGTWTGDTNPDKSKGQLTFDLNTATEAALEKLGRRSFLNGWLEVIGWSDDTSEATVVFSIKIDCRIRNITNPTGVAPVPYDMDANIAAAIATAVEDHDGLAEPHDNAGFLTDVASDATLTGDGTSGDPLIVAAAIVSGAAAGATALQPDLQRQTVTNANSVAATKDDVSEMVVDGFGETGVNGTYTRNPEDDDEWVKGDYRIALEASDLVIIDTEHATHPIRYISDGPADYPHLATWQTLSGGGAAPVGTVESATTSTRLTADGIKDDDNEYVHPLMPQTDDDDTAGTDPTDYASRYVGDELIGVAIGGNMKIWRASAADSTTDWVLVFEET